MLKKIFNYYFLHVDVVIIQRKERDVRINHIYLTTVLVEFIIKIFYLEKYSVFCDYLYWTFETPNSKRTKLYMLDIAKKLLIQKPEIQTIQGLQHYFLRYYHHNNKENIVYDPADIYKYYQLDIPPEEWVDKCKQENCII